MLLVDVGQGPLEFKRGLKSTRSWLLFLSFWSLNLSCCGHAAEFWSKGRFNKGKKPVKPLSVKGRLRLATRKAIEEAEAPFRDFKYGTGCYTSFLEERVRWNEGDSNASHLQLF